MCAFVAFLTDEHFLNRGIISFYVQFFIKANLLNEYVKKINECNKLCSLSQQENPSKKKVSAIKAFHFVL